MSTVAKNVAGAGLERLISVRQQSLQPTEIASETNPVQTATNAPYRSAKPVFAGSIPARCSN
jgi:hypothetical protein